MGTLPTLTGTGLFKSPRHMTDTVADYFVNEGEGTPRQVYRWFQQLAKSEGSPLNTTFADVDLTCRLLAMDLSLEEDPLLIEVRKGVYSLNNVNAW
jgi:hypothetical protein